MEHKGITKTIKGQQPNRKKIFMLVEFEPSSIVTGGPISATDPQALETINEMMDRVFDFVCR